MLQENKKQKFVNKTIMIILKYSAYDDYFQSRKSQQKSFSKKKITKELKTAV